MVFSPEQVQERERRISKFLKSLTGDRQFLLTTKSGTILCELKTLVENSDRSLEKITYRIVANRYEGEKFVEDIVDAKPVIN